MDVIVYVILTEAVIPLTARAVSELKLGICRIGAAAHRAFMAVFSVLVFIFGLFGGASESGGAFRAIWRRALEAEQETAAAKEQEVEDSDKRREVEREAAHI